MYGRKSGCFKNMGPFNNYLSALLLTATLLGCQQTTSPESSDKPTNPAIQAVGPIAQLQLEWADSPQKQQIGLMNRAQLPENSGMVFVFEQVKAHCFWMKNTLIPLDIGFIDAQGRLVQIESMQAQTTDVHCPKQDVAYALEVNQGWFAQHQVKPGTQMLKIR